MVLFFDGAAQAQHTLFLADGVFRRKAAIATQILIEFFADGREELYSLAEDPSEQHNVAAQNPEMR